MQANREVSIVAQYNISSLAPSIQLTGYHMIQTGVVCCQDSFASLLVPNRLNIVQGSGTGAARSSEVTLVRAIFNAKAFQLLNNKGVHISCTGEPRVTVSAEMSSTRAPTGVECRAGVFPNALGVHLTSSNSEDDGIVRVSPDTFLIPSFFNSYADSRKILRLRVGLNGQHGKVWVLRLTPPSERR